MLSRVLGGRLVFAVVLALGAMGCPRPQDLPPVLLLSDETLNFGTTLNSLQLTVAKSFTARSIGPVVVTSKVPWIIVSGCTDPANGCTSEGPRDPINLRITVDRSKTTLGTNTGIIQVGAVGANQEEVTIYVEDIIQADFSVDRRQVEPGRAVTFTDTSATTAASGGIISRRWNFGDGTTSTAENPVHIYQQPGNYNVTLTVNTATTSETMVRIAYLTVGDGTSGGGATADFSASETVILEGDAVTFTDLSIPRNTPILRRLWDFGDGATSTETNPTKQFINPGVYTVSLTVFTEFGTANETKEDYILVQRSSVPRAQFTISPLKPVVGQSVRFTDLSQPGSAPIDSRVWEFGDGNFSTDENPTHAYDAVGTYTARLTVKSADGTSSKSLEVEVLNRPPVANFALSTATPSTTDTVQFTDQSTNGTLPIVSWNWNFGDGSPVDTRRNPTHRFITAGTYTITLTVDTGVAPNNTDSLSRTVTVVRAPVVSFTVVNPGVFVGDTVTFDNTTTEGSETGGIDYEWNFGEAGSATNTSTEEDATHVYAAPGTYTVTLRATTRTLTVTATRTVTVDAKPTVNFSATPSNALVGQPVQFANLTTLGTDTTPEYVLEFGDGTTSTEPNVQHVYNTPGTRTARLTLTYEHTGTGDTFTTSVTKEVIVEVPVAPEAGFEVDTPRPVTGIEVNFTDTSTPGNRPITSWAWDFGDGATSTDRNPSHTYTTEGDFQVRLTVTSSALPPGTNSDTATLTLAVNQSTALDEFVRREEPGLPGFTQTNTIEFPGTSVLPGSTAFLLSMTSQTWRTANEVYQGRTWRHNLSVIVPENATEHSTALLVIKGGQSNSGPPTQQSLAYYPTFAAVTGTVVAVLENVPSQPIQFADPSEQGRLRVEDEIIAYSFRKYLESAQAGEPDNDWPALFPMTKAAVKAMDAVQEFLADFRPIDDFVVTGFSKRGWTTWLTAASDPRGRIRGIMPGVFDALNLDEQVRHHKGVYGFYSTSIYDYMMEEVLDPLLGDENKQLDEEVQGLLDLVDPYEYRDRLTMPKLILNSTGDEFFVSDSAQFYFDDLPGESHLNYVPNTDHDLGINGEFRDALADMFAWYAAVVQEIERPQFSWAVQPNGTIEVTSETPPTQVLLWKATNPDARDFRRETIGDAWTSSTLVPGTDGTYTASVIMPPEGWTAFFVQLKFANEAEGLANFPVPGFTMTTEVHVVPDVLPDFEGERTEQGRITRLVLHGTPEEMGEDYGRLMADEIQEFIPAFLAAAQAENPEVNPATLDAAWLNQAPKMDPRVVMEINAIADGAGISRQMLQQAHMVPVVETGVYSGSGLTVWDDASADDGGTVLQGYALNWPLTRRAQDFPVVVMYIPDRGFPHVNVTFAGFAFAHYGMNFDGVGLMEMDRQDDEQTFSGERLHFMPLFREIFYDSRNISEAQKFIAETPPTRAHQYLIGDGRYEMRGLKATVDPFLDPQFDADRSQQDEFFPNIFGGVVYAGENSRTRTSPFIDENYGFINAEGEDSEGSLQEIIRQLGTDDNILNVVTNNFNLDLDVSFADGDSQAYEQEFELFNLQSVLP